MKDQKKQVFNILNILVIMGSPHRGTTYRACEELRHCIEQEIPVEFEYLWLMDVNLLSCKGCGLCFTRGEKSCPNLDESHLIEQKMQQADAIIFASPVYALNVTGQMKVFIDRFSYNFHRPQFFDKKAFILTTTAILGHKDVLKYLEMVAGLWGFEIAGKMGLVTPDPLPDYRKDENQKVIKKSAKKFISAFRQERRKSPSLKDVIIFHGQRGSFRQLKDISPFDYHYWKDNGWFEDGINYFIDIPVNPLYHAIGMIVEWFSARQVQKDLRENPG